MKIATHSSGYRRFAIEKVFEIAARTGFDGVELSGRRPHAYVYDMTPADIDKFHQLKEKYNLEIPVYTPGVLGGIYSISSPDKAIRMRRSSS